MDGALILNERFEIHFENFENLPSNPTFMPEIQHIEAGSNVDWKLPIPCEYSH